MVSRYEGSATFINSNDLYHNVLKKRNVKQITQFETKSLKYPTEEEMSNLLISNHAWTRGDSYTKLAHKSYGDSRLWWVIAHFNQKPLQSEVDFGDIVYIPEPLELVLNYYGV
jgi:nucleoid-associated protein YgaU